ncbi:hypothetical protein TSAR_014598 [Trichomalopsis sarcophagae]|uniref:Uncharacterized protein n=1 Tax=Trichomalopsis sarcophagae TaxID=543379 RepID=A0A232F2A9_9HYME|nr:hypothetical protein TSAR_014598 [Trichomalopsis sarcophagae]
MDRKPVTMLTSAFNPTETVEITRKLKDGSRLPIFCPFTIQAYNKIMGCVDRDKMTWLDVNPQGPDMAMEKQ